MTPDVRGPHPGVGCELAVLRRCAVLAMLGQQRALAAGGDEAQVLLGGLLLGRRGRGRLLLLGLLCPAGWLPWRAALFPALSSSSELGSICPCADTCSLGIPLACVGAR